MSTGIFDQHVTESWLPVRGFPGYSVSDQGRVRNDETGRVLKPFPRSFKNQYLGVDLRRFGRRYPKRVHRLVAEAFLPRRADPIAREVNHLNADPADNRAVNLEWCTRQENEAHKRFMEIAVCGTSPGTRGTSLRGR